MLPRPARKRAPCTAAFSIIPSSTSTRSAARATAQVSGLPPKVEPYWPGFRVPSTALFERTAAAGQRLAEQRHVCLDGIVLSASSLPVRPSPVWISSRISITSCAVQISRTLVK